MKRITLLILSILFGLMFVNGGLNKFFNYMPVPENMPEESMKDFGAMMEIVWLMPLLASAELVGGILIMIPKTRALGAIMIVPIMFGILLSHIYVDTSGLPIALVLAAILTWIIVDNRDKYMHMIK